jgi:hypothetical protein
LLEFNKFHGMLYHGSATTNVQTSLLQLTLSSNSICVLVTNLLVLFILGYTKQSEPSQDLLEYNKFHDMFYHGSATTDAQTPPLLQLILSSNSMVCLSYKQSKPPQDLLDFNKFHTMLYHGSATTGAQTSLLQLTLSSDSICVLVSNLLVLFIL